MDELFKEAERQLEICNACRYCEGFCPVFPAMERRTVFDEQFISYMGNLCHDCKECYYACPYTPPHELRVDVPKTFKEVRMHTYRKFSWPSRSIIFDKRLGLMAIIVAISIFVMALPSLISGPSILSAPTSFYGVIPRTYIVIGGLALGALIALIIVVEFLKFWQWINGSLGGLTNPRAFIPALGQAFSHKWFRGSAAGCVYPAKPMEELKDTRTRIRFIIHMMVMYGFILTFASTVLAYIHEDFLHIPPPYPLLGPVVLTGMIGGTLILAGAIVMNYFKRRYDPPSDSLHFDYTFIVILGLVSITGLLTLALRESSVAGITFIAHMGLVLTLLLILPYTKFVHSIYRYAALVKNKTEETREK